MKYRIIKGNTSHQCAWIVQEAEHKHDWEPIAEFWSRRDAMSFRKLKNKEKYESK